MKTKNIKEYKDMIIAIVKQMNEVCGDYVTRLYVTSDGVYDSNGKMTDRKYDVEIEF